MDCVPTEKLQKDYGSGKMSTEEHSMASQSTKEMGANGGDERMSPEGT